MQTVAMGGAHPPPLTAPPLREDLRLYPSTPDADGAPTWTIYDPVRGRYFQISWAAFRMLSAWHQREPDAILQAAMHNTTLELDESDIQDLIIFLRANNLVAADAPGQMDSYLNQINATKVGLLKKLLHNYLFFRIPVLRPEPFLQKMVDALGFVFHPVFFLIVGLLGLIGIVFAIRRWDEFLGTFMHFFSWEGAALMGVTIALVKIAHEFGHALVAKRFGCRVYSMGVAFLVMFPVLYTDVTDAWRLTDRRRRLIIASAGIITELCIALLATFAWSFLPEGPLKSLTFMLAAVTWITTLAVNLNPFMKFDGYFIFADWVGINNLQDRAFDLAKWRLREFLFGWNEPAPEPMGDRHYYILLIWGYVTWIWRFFLFLGIALLVYHMFFKLLGIFLMVIELVWFIFNPIKKELAVWWKRREDIRLNRKSIRTLLLLLGGLLILMVPWKSEVRLPASMHALAYQTLHPAVPSRIARVVLAPETDVKAGDLLYELTSPDLEFELAQVELEINITRAVISRQAASPHLREQLSILENQLSTYEARRSGLLEQKAQLEVRAPFAGRLRDVPQGLFEGAWVHPKMPLGRLVAQDQRLVVGYLSEKDLKRIVLDAKGMFIPDDLSRTPVALSVSKIEATALKTLDNLYVASSHGGAVAVHGDQQKGLIPVEAHYRVWLTPQTQDTPVDMVTVGEVHIEADSINPLSLLWHTAAAVLIREMGF